MIAESAMAGEAIALAHQEGDLLETAVRQYAGFVYRIANSVLRNPADAEDATQEVFLRVLRYKKRIAQIEDRRAWLARIAWRVAVERRDSMAKTAGRTEGRSEDRANAGLEGLIAPGRGADRVLLEQERTAIFERLISSLPYRLRDALVLSTIEEIAPREVATMLGISEAAVRSRSFRAREILREKVLALTGQGREYGST